jgi:hypothetical protein
MPTPEKQYSDLKQGPYLDPSLSEFILKVSLLISKSANEHNFEHPLVHLYIMITRCPESRHDLSPFRG